jgi:hypothetical protein
VHQQNGTKHIITLQDIKYVPSLNTNLFSNTRARWQLGNTAVNITLNNNNGKIIVDQVDPTSFGNIITAKKVTIPINHNKHEEWSTSKQDHALSMMHLRQPHLHQRQIGTKQHASNEKHKKIKHLNFKRRRIQLTFQSYEVVTAYP